MSKNMQSENMQNKNMENEKTQNKKSVVRFAVIMILCALGGSLAGFASAIMRAENLPGILKELLRANAPALIVIVFVVQTVFPILMLRYYLQMRRLQKTVDWDADNATDAIDRVFGKAGVLFGFISAMELVLLGIFIYCVNLLTDASSFLILVGLMLLFVAMMLSNLFVYRGMVSVQKQLNPEKQGDVLHIMFHKEWEKSSDEGQKRIIYEGGYRAFFTTLIAGIIAELVALVGMITFDMGLMPVILIGIILVVGQVRFGLAQYRLEERGRSAHGQH